MWIKLQVIPEDIKSRYNLTSIQTNGRVLVQIVSAMYELPQAGIIAQPRLIPHLAKFGYHPCPNTPCLFKHASNSERFAVVVDDFGIQYEQDSDV